MAYIVILLTLVWASPTSTKALVGPDDRSDTPCDEWAAGWKAHRGNCYRLVVERIDYATARQLCQSYGGLPASITYIADQIFVNALISEQRAALARIGGDATVNGVFIGLVKRRFGNVYQFQWENGAPTFYENWAPGEPNNMDMRSHQPEPNANVVNQGCVRVPHKNGVAQPWDDYSCESHTQGVICERQLDGSNIP